MANQTIKGVTLSGLQFELIAEVEVYDHARRWAQRQAQDAANTYGYAWLFRHHDEWQIAVSRTSECAVLLTDEAEFFMRKEKAPE